ncbi:hypothetical protein FGB62_29g229 [Gracilaria domingensis]|nr:hypothetical protein FGB62_29g229 [Gracilaria domingensis]
MYVRTALYNNVVGTLDLYKAIGTDQEECGTDFLFIECYKHLRTAHLRKAIECSIDRKSSVLKDYMQELQIDCAQIPGTSTKNSVNGTRHLRGTKVVKEKLQKVCDANEMKIKIEDLIQLNRKQNEIAEHNAKIKARLTRMQICSLPGKSDALRQEFIEALQKDVPDEIEDEQRIKTKSSCKSLISASTDNSITEHGQDEHPNGKRRRDISYVPTAPEGTDVGGQKNIRED